MHLDSTRPLLDAYRSLGQVLSSHLFVQRSPTPSLLSCSSHSYKIYDSQLKIQNISPVFPSPISGIYSYNNSTLVRTGTRLVKMSYSHIVKEWDIQKEVAKSIILVFGELILLAEGKELIVIDGDRIELIEFEFEIRGVIHPITYVNKILVYGEKNLQLWNIVTKYKVHDFSTQFQSEIVYIAPSPKVDVIGISIDKKVILFNLKTAKILFELQQKEQSQVLSFSDQGIPMLATGDSFGVIRVWSLHEKNIIGVFKGHAGTVDYLEFMPGELLLLSGSKEENSIKQWKFDEGEASQFRKLRHREGLKGQIIRMDVQSNTELVLTSNTQTMYLSLISDNNSYIIPKTLDSVLPTHIIAKGTKLDIYKNQTKTQTLESKINIQGGKISQSQNYFIVYQNNKLIRLGGGDSIEWVLDSNIVSVAVNEPYYIFAITKGAFYALPFTGQGEVYPQKQCDIEGGNMLALSIDRSCLTYGGKQIMVINAKTLNQIRKFQTTNSPQIVSFSQDNRFLFSSNNKSLQIWDILYNSLYKQFELENKLVSHQMTPDGSFFLSVAQGQRKVSVWNNFIGVVATNENIQKLKFQTLITKLPTDLRRYLNNITISHKFEANIYQELQKQLDEIPDAHDKIAFTSQPLSQWLPLIHYDEIKERNKPISVVEKKTETPFFLDTENKTKFINKMDQQHREKIELQSRILNEKEYKLMEENSKKLAFSRSSDKQVIKKQYDQLMETLKQLSLAEIDYQMRTLLLTPANVSDMAQFFEYLFESKYDYDLKIVYYYRFLTLLGTSVIQNPQINHKIKKWRSVSELYQYNSQVVERITLEAQTE